MTDWIEPEALGLVRAVEEDSSAREAAARFAATLSTTIGQLLHTFSPAECRNSLTNAGYAFDESENVSGTAWTGRPWL